jgi:DMSO reductase anchor subunit
LSTIVQDNGLFLAVRIIFGLVIPLALAIMTWRTVRIRSLDSATGLLYIMCALILTGEIVARTLFFLNGVAT